MKSQEFLLEIGVEEIPHSMIPGALNDLERGFLGALEDADLRQGVEVTTEATPRRLVLVANGVADRQADREETLKGPPRNVAFDAEGKPTKAAEGFAKRAGLQVEDLETGGDGRLVAKRLVKGRPTSEILAEVLPAVILGIHFPKAMYWTEKTGARFIRPIRSLLALLDGEVVPFEIEGVRSGNRTFGHRRLGAGKIQVSGWEDYKRKLEENFVILSADERSNRIKRGYEEFYPPTTSNVRVRYNPELLEDLVYLTEYPTVIPGDFDPRFLSLPDEVLETVMLHHQKYFAVEDENGKLAAHFVAVANLDGDPDGVIRQGHERVLRARFSDAEFFWQADQKRKLSERVEDLKLVTYHAKLGSYYDKTRRNQSLVAALAEVTGGLSQQQYDDARRAAELAKCDLTTEMVGEFPELQGVIGGLYAGVQGESKEVADAIYDHYKPGAAHENLPRGPIGQIVAIADKLHTLGGMFRLGMIPTGSKDPFALRRAAYGIVLIVVRGELPLTISTLCGLAGAGENTAELREFFLERLRHFLREEKGFKYDEVNAVLAAADDDPQDVVARCDAIARGRQTEDFEPLALSFKRIKNILEQAGGIEQFDGKLVDESLLESGPETKLFQTFEKLRPRVAEHKGRGDYVSALTAIASLRPDVDLFFDEVLVMAERKDVRRNRLTFLAQLLGEFSIIADFAEIVSA